MINKSLLIYADNIRSKGGVVLLKSLLDQLEDVKVNIFINDDFRFASKISVNWMIYKVPNNIFFKFTKNVQSIYHKSDVKLYFGNIPPFFKTKNSYLFVQNALLLEAKNIKYYKNLFLKMQFLLNFLLLRIFGRNCDKIILQNNHSVSIARKIWTDDIVQFPFIPSMKKVSKTKKKYDFIFVGGFDPHKNLLNLLKSWQICKKLGMVGSIAITITESEFKKKISLQNSNELNIILLGHLPHSKTIEAISQSKCLIFSSTIESLALPLIEAKLCNVDIIASEQDFVYEVCDPNTTFIETNVNSICRAIFRYKKVEKRTKLLSIKSMKDFKQYILK